MSPSTPAARARANTTATTSLACIAGAAEAVAAAPIRDGGAEVAREAGIWRMRAPARPRRLLLAMRSARGRSGRGRGRGRGLASEQGVGDPHWGSRGDADADVGREDEPPYGYEDRDPVYSPAADPEGYLPPQHPYGNRGADYPGGTYFPPPPPNEFAHAGAREAPPATEAYPAYNPADYAQPGRAGHGPYGAPYTESNVTLGAPYPNETFAGDPRFGAPPERSRSKDPRGPADVSASEFQPAATDAPAASKTAASEEASTS